MAFQYVGLKMKVPDGTFIPSIPLQYVCLETNEMFISGSKCISNFLTVPLQNNDKSYTNLSYYKT